MTDAPISNRQLVESSLRDQLAEVLKLPAARIDVQKPIKDFGLDSLMALELLKRIEKVFGKKLPLSTFINEPTVEQMAGKIADGEKKPKMGTIMRRASVADKDAIWNFIKVAYGDSSKHMLERWNWQYRENPYIKKEQNFLPMVLAVKDDQIVAQNCETPVKLKVGEEIYRATWGNDFIVLPDSRGQGVGLSLMQFHFKQTKLIMGLWLPFLTRSINEYLGAKTLDPVNAYWRPVRMHRFFVNSYLMLKTQNKPFSHRLVKILCRFFFFDRLIPIILNIVWGLRDFVERRTKEKGLCDIQEVDYFDERIDDFWHSTSGQYEIIVKRDKEFLNWRYSLNHQITYRKFIATRDGETKGYLVLRKAEPEELNVGKIIDLYASRNDQQTIEDLIRHSIQFFGNDVEVIDCATSAEEYQRAFSKFGFFKVETQAPMYHCKDASLADKLESRKSECFFTKGDHDWDQFVPVQTV